MKLFKKSTLGLALTTALTGGTMMGVSTPAQAVNIAQDGLGEVLIFPYYTTRAGWATYFNVTNTSDKTVIAKVRWREGVNSREVRDFNIILSPYDVWTAATVNTTEGAKMVTSDNSCTAPKLPTQGGSLTGIDFTNLAYAGTHADGGPATMDRTREGYFTVLEMGVARTEAVQTARDAVHAGGAGNNTQVPRNCNNIIARTQNDFAALAAEFDEPQNVLKGRAVLINTASGIAAGYDPTVLANFYNPNGTDATSANDNIVSQPANDAPNLNDAFPPIAQWIDDTPGVGPILQTEPAFAPGRPVDAVSVLFNRSSVINDYNIATNSETDWVVTSPTKRYYVDEANSVFAAVTPEGGFAPAFPFDASVSGEEFHTVVNGASCFDIRLNIWDREEYKANQITNLQFSPPIPGAPGDKLCYETNIISFGDSNVMGSKLRLPVPAANLPGLNGWAELNFGLSSVEELPVIGMRIEKRQKDTVQASYGFANTHSFKRQP